MHVGKCVLFGPALLVGSRDDKGVGGLRLWKEPASALDPGTVMTGMAQSWGCIHYCHQRQGPDVPCPLEHPAWQMQCCEVYVAYHAAVALCVGSMLRLK